MCDDDESEHCIGVSLQIFLTLQIGTSTIMFYVSLIPAWDGYSNVQGATNAMCFGIFVFMMILCYFKAYLTSPGNVPDDYQHDLENQEVRENGKPPRYCTKCDLPKPPRAHHCRLCKRCVLRMDHHCPWVQNCVGALNLKYFVLFLFYAAISCFYYAASAIMMMFSQLGTKDTRPSGGSFIVILLTAIISCCLGLMVVGLLIWNMWLILHNQTTIENYEVEVKTAKAKRDDLDYRHPYDLGKMRNMQQVFGQSPFVWLFPFKAESDGINFPRYTQLDGSEGIEMA